MEEVVCGWLLEGYEGRWCGRSWTDSEAAGRSVAGSVIFLDLYC